MECACIIEQYHDDVDLDEACTSKRIVSKTVHKCCECNKNIPVGEQYLLEVVRWDDKNKGRYKTCKDCESVRDILFCGWTYTNIWEDLYSAIEYMEDESIPWSAISKLTPIAREGVLSIIEDIWRIDDDL